MLYAAALVASGRHDGDGLSAWPWTLDIDGKRMHYPTRGRAAAAFREARREGAKVIAVGVMGLPPGAGDSEELLDPTKNLERGAALIGSGLRSHPDDRALGIGSYRYAVETEARSLGDRVIALTRALKEPHAQTIRTVTGPARGRIAECLPHDKREVAAAVEKAARRHGVDPSFALAIAKHESAFRQTALSPKGARGVMQLMPGTARRYGADARNLTENIDAGVRYLRDLAGLFGGDPMLVAAGYNAGEQAVIRNGYRIPPYRETRSYVPLVLATRGELMACGGK